MSDKFVRIKNPDTGHEETVPAAFAEAYKLPVIDKDAVDANGRPLTPKPHIELAKAEPKTGDESTETGGTNPPADSSGATDNPPTEPPKAEQKPTTTTRSGGAAR